MASRAGYIYLYANNIIKWSGIDSGMINVIYSSRVFFTCKARDEKKKNRKNNFCKSDYSIKMLMQLAGGNSALALAMTVISNLLGILIIPFSVSRLVASGVGVSVPIEQLFRSLVVTLLVPLILGKVVRESFKGVADFADQNRTLLAVMSAVFLSLVPWIQVSRSRSLLVMVEPVVFLVAMAMGALLHAVLLLFNGLATRVLSTVSGGSRSPFASRQNASALLLVASQKTLPVMVAVVEQLGGALGESGLLVLPCVAAHLIQIVMDSFLVSWLQGEHVVKTKAA